MGAPIGKDGKTAASNGKDERTYYGKGKYTTTGKDGKINWHYQPNEVEGKTAPIGKDGKGKTDPIGKDGKTATPIGKDGKTYYGKGKYTTTGKDGKINYHYQTIEVEGKTAPIGKDGKGKTSPIGKDGKTAAPIGKDGKTY